MLRGFRHTLFLLLQIGVVASAALAVAIWPDSWRAVALCVAGALLASLICERIASRYLRRTLGKLRRTADDIGHGRHWQTLEAHPGDDFYKMVSAINLVAQKVSDAAREEQRLQEELHRRERLAFLGELAATVAHEVNNPLDGIQNCSRILRRSLEDPRRARQMLDLIDSGLSRIDLIVRRLLTLAREHVIRPVEGRIRDVLDSSLTMAKGKLDEAGLRVLRQYETDEDRALIDPQLLEQVFVNLFANAADSMDRGAELTVAMRRTTSPQPPGDGDSAGSIIIDVCDRGAGIPADILPHIFEPFFTTKGGGKGTGLGLPIASRIVDAHGGTLDVRPRDGGGTVFTVTLPALPVPTPEPLPALTAAGSRE
jgi:signal transduction histidine kinase